MWSHVHLKQTSFKCKIVTNRMKSDVEIELSQFKDCFVIIQMIDIHKGDIGIINHYIKDPYETISTMDFIRFCRYCSLDGFTSKNVFFHQDLVKSLLNCASGEPGFRCKILDSGRILQTKEPFFGRDFNGGFVFASDFFGCFFAIWNPDFWSEFRWPTVGILVALSQSVFSEEIRNSGNCFLYSKILWETHLELEEQLASL